MKALSALVLLALVAQCCAQGVGIPVAQSSGSEARSASGSRYQYDNVDVSAAGYGRQPGFFYDLGNPGFGDLTYAYPGFPVFPGYQGVPYPTYGYNGYPIYGYASGYSGFSDLNGYGSLREADKALFNHLFSIRLLDKEQDYPGFRSN